MSLIRVVVLLFLTTVGFAQSVAEAPRPNVVLIISDDQAWTDYGFMGHPRIRTPHLDRLAAQSRSFRRGYVPTSLCCPSLVSILTGLYPHQHGITGNEPPMPRRGRRSPEYPALRERFISPVDTLPALPRRLAERGYVSFQSGKWWLGNFARGGFTHGMTHGDTARGGRHGDDGLAIGRRGLAPIERFLDDTVGTPFFLWYAPFLPHRPHNPPERILARYRKQCPSPFVARYEASCEWFDETCGALLKILDDRGLAKNTLVLYVTDNGWIQDEGSPGYAMRSKRSPYDGGLRTPLLVRWPGYVEPSTSETPVSSIDLAPTVLRACGLSAPDLPGVDLLDDAAVQARTAIFGECHLHDARDLEDPARNLTYRWVLSGRLKLLVPNEINLAKHAAPGARGRGGAELYDVVRDPFETHDLSTIQKSAAKTLRRSLDAWWPATPR